MLSSDESACSTYSTSRSRNCNRSAANERERKRMQSLSRAFTTLRTVIPWIPSDTKLSKLDTLTAAIDYISCLNDILKLPNLSDGAFDEDPIQLIAQHRKSWLTSVKTTSGKWRRSDGESLCSGNSPNGQQNCGAEDSGERRSIFRPAACPRSDDTCCTEQECKCSDGASVSTSQLGDSE